MKESSLKGAVLFLILTSVVFENSVFLSGIHILAFIFALISFFFSRQTIKKDGLLLLVFLFVLYSLFLRDYSEGLWRTIGLPQMSITLAICSLTFLIVYSQSDSKYLMKCFVNSVILLSILTIILVNTSIIHGLHSDEADEILKQYGYNSNSIAAFTSIGAVFSIIKNDMKWKNNPQFLYLFLFSLLSGSRTVILFFVVIIFVAYVVAKGNLLKIVFGTFAIGSIMFLVLQIDFVYDIIGERFLETFNVAGNFLKTGDYNDITETRLRMIVIGWNYFIDSIWFGNGLNSFSIQYSIINGRDPVYSHCNIIEILCNTGLVGFIIYYSRFFYLIKSVLKHKTNKRLLAIIGLLFALLVMDVSVITYYYKVYYIVLAIIGVYVREQIKCSTYSSNLVFVDNAKS